MRRCQVIDVCVTQEMGYGDRSRGYAGMSPGEPLCMVKLTLQCTPDAARYLMALLRQPNLDLDNLMGSAGVDRPDLKRAYDRGLAEGRQQGVQMGAEPGTLVQLAEYMGGVVDPANRTRRIDTDMERKAAFDDARARAGRIQCTALRRNGDQCTLEDGHDGEHMVVLPGPRSGISGLPWSGLPDVTTARTETPAQFSARAEREAFAEVARAAGLPATCGWIALKDAVSALRIAALPPYEPKTAPACRTCRECGSPTIVRLARRTQIEFTACTAWPACKWTFVPPAPVPKAKPVGARLLELDDEEG